LQARRATTPTLFPYTTLFRSAQAYGSAAEPVDEGGQHPAVEPVEAALVHLEHLEGGFGGVEVEFAAAAHLRPVLNAAQEAVRDPRGTARTLGDLHRCCPLELHTEQAS